MDDELLSIVYRRLVSSASALGPGRCRFSDGVIALIYLLAVLHDRSPHWAIDRRNWPLWMRGPVKPPSYSQFIRRLKSSSVQRLLEALNAEFRDQLPRGQLKLCDGKPLVIGGFSKDPDARWGKVPDGWAKGYKVHVLGDSLGIIEAFEVTPLNSGEATVARALVCRVDLCGTVIRTDSNYDSNKLYAAVSRRGARLIAPRREPGSGIGHCPQHPDRLRAIAELEGDATVIKAHRRLRAGIEQRLAHLTNLPFGLSPLPNFVRRQRRVSRWVLGKIMLYHLHLYLSRVKAKAA